jgi:hypothetical protein
MGFTASIATGMQEVYMYKYMKLAPFLKRLLCCGVVIKDRDEGFKNTLENK